MTSLKSISTAGLIASALLLGGTAQAEMLNLTYGVQDGVAPSDPDGGGPLGVSFVTDSKNVEFSIDFEQPAGTGVFGSFLRIQRKGTEQGYNTTVPKKQDIPYDNVDKDGHTRDVLYTDLAKPSDQDPYYYFLLDINEGNADNENQSNQSLLSLDGLRLYAVDHGGEDSAGRRGNGPNNGNPPDEPDWGGPSSGDFELLWDMDDLVAGNEPDNWILLDADLNNTGSGAADMVMRVGRNIIDDAFSKTDNKGELKYSNLILWSRFGLMRTADVGLQSWAGFEEWATLVRKDAGFEPPGEIPVPAPLALLGLGMALLSWKTRKPIA